MKKSVLISIQPYWGFLIIAEGRGWDLNKYHLHKKTVELRKRFPVDEEWDGSVLLYFSKDSKSLARIPEEYRGEVAKLCGKVVCEFVCDRISDIRFHNLYGYVGAFDYEDMGLVSPELQEYAKGETVWGLHISELKIYDKPKELSEFKKAGFMTEEEWLFNLYPNTHCHYEAWAKKFNLDRPPQSWCYIMPYLGI